MRNLENYIKNKYNPFLKMDAEARYWIGYIFADGNITYNKRHYNIKLFSKNEDIMNKFKIFIGDKACFYKRSDGIFWVIYSSKPTTKWFIDTFNVPQDKALTLNPTCEIDWDILHGYFDGDGCIRLTNHKGGGPRYEMQITTGSEKWKDRIVEFLTSFNLRTHVYKKGNAYDIRLTGKETLRFMYEHMYASGTSTLDYKYNRFVALFGDKQ